MLPINLFEFHSAPFSNKKHPSTGIDHDYPTILDLPYIQRQLKQIIKQAEPPVPSVPMIDPFLALVNSSCP